MNRREFSMLGLGVTGAGLMGGVQAQALKPQAGADYLTLEKRAPVEAPAGRIEVVEFFWYNCPHCNAFEPALEAWIKRVPKDVSVRRVPVGFRDSFVPQQRLFYALEAMDLLDRLHGKVFAAIHAEKKDLSKGDAIADWVAQQGVDRAKFVERYNDFSVASKAGKATQLQNSYRVEGVPALGVAGRYYTDGTLAKNMPRALQIVDYLVAEVRAGR
jgi:protein dithiol oxidoreductase (disulfide-forming)